MSAKGDRKKRARMGGVDKTPESSTPRKRKAPTRVRTIKDMFGTSENQENEGEENNKKTKKLEFAATEEVVIANSSTSVEQRGEFIGSWQQWL